ncbi:MAG: TonB-dependent receptor [Balneolaceae bacterium]|nr:TonB-dependent receptor [Balneolaceae bacterium]MCH8547402.1 TonB-dependent receptor [Balneolaceae bacterium]
MSKQLLTMLTLAGLILFSPAIYSQPSQPTPEPEVTDSLQLDRIVITASKIPLSQRETTKPVIIIDRQEIERSGSRDLSQILNNQSGIRVNDSYGAPSNGRILYLQGAAAANTLILLDGLPISDPSGVGGLFDLRLLPTNNIEQIEVIKGSQSTLYGTDAIAGVVNLITREGGPEPISGSARLSYGAYNTFNGSVGVQGSALPSLRYSLHYNRESSDGFSAAEDPNGTGDFEADGYELDSFYGRFDWDLTSNLTISPFLNYSNNEGEYDDGAFMDADNRYELRMFNPGVQAVYSDGPLRVNGGYNFTRTNRSFLTEFSENEFEADFHNADLFANYEITPNLLVLGGVNAQDFSIPGGIDDAGSRDAQILSPYATLYLRNLNGFSAEIGYRLNSHSEYGTNATYSFAPSFDVNENLRFFGSITTGFKAPTLDELFGPFGPNPDLDPQRSLYMNFGTELYLLANSLKLSANFFTRDIDDLIVFTFDPGYINRDRQEDYGVELSADWIVSNRLSLGGWYNYLEGEITTLDDAGEETSFNNLIRRPTHSFGMRAGVQITDRLYAAVDGEFNGERTDLFFDPANNFAQEEVALDRYTLVNLYASYSIPAYNLSLFADVKNLFNSDFTEVYGFNTTGIALNGGVRFSF